MDGLNQTMGTSAHRLDTHHARQQMTQEHWAKGTRLVLLGGGVGINPLVSILRHICAWLEGPEAGGDDKGFRVSLVHSAATVDVCEHSCMRVCCCMWIMGID